MVQTTDVSKTKYVEMYELWIYKEKAEVVNWGIDVCSLYPQSTVLQLQNISELFFENFA